MADKGSGATEVEIYGATYHVRADKDPEYLQEVARELDRRMRDIAGHLTSVDPRRVAILAALNLADELLQQQRQQEGEQSRFRDKAAELVSELENALRH